MTLLVRSEELCAAVKGTSAHTHDTYTIYDALW